MKLLRMAGLATGLMMILVWAGCGDTYRPVANPIAPPGGNPQAQRLALVVYATTPSSSGTCPKGTVSGGVCPGFTSQIDVSGDTDMADVWVGDLGPFAVAPAYGINAVNQPTTYSVSSGTAINRIYAIFATDGVYVANNLDSTLSEFGTYSGGVTPTLVALPPNAQPMAMAEATNKLVIYVADAADGTVTPVSEITNTMATAAPIPVGPTPVAVVSTIDGSKVYVANYGDGTVSAITTTDNAVNSTTGTPITVGSSPVALVSNSLGSEIYVLNEGSGNLSVINPFTDLVLGTVPLPSATSPSYMFFESHKQRLYVSDQGSGNVWVLDASQTNTGLPVLLQTISVGGAPGPMAALADGSKVYVAKLGAATSCQVKVINTTSNTASSCIDLSLGAPTWIAASGDGSKVYVTETGGTSIITTSTNQVTKTITAPANRTPVFVVVQ